MDQNELKIYDVQLILQNEFGKFIGKKFPVTKEEYDNLINMSKTFYITGGFEITCEDESYMVFTPEMVKKSILTIKKTEIKNV
jgi:hypothetical protein